LSADGYLDYWGKARAEDQAAPFHRLAYHSLDVAAVAAGILEQAPRWLQRIAALSGFTPECLSSNLPYFLALHDLGKFSEPFQDQRPDLVAEFQGKRERRLCALYHDSLGYLLWRAWASRRVDPREALLLSAIHPVVAGEEPLAGDDAADVMQSWMAAVLGHHGKPPEEATLPFGVFNTFPGKPFALSRVDAASFALAVRDLLHPAPLAAQLTDVDALIASARASSWWIAGFAILCDWLGSNTDFFPYEDRRMALGEYWVRARGAARRAVESSGITGGRPMSFRGMNALFPRIAEPTPLQRAASEIEIGEGPQLYVLEDLTGAGKTEAALVLAQRLISAGRADGLFFALPTMATANAMHERVAPLLEKLFEGPASYLLTHSGPQLTERDLIAIGGAAVDGPYARDEQPTATRTASAWLADGRKKALLADLGVGTIDQALLAALQSKHAALRLLGLHHHVLIVDEVHACDAYMLGVLAGLLRIQARLGGSAILLSATLPLEQRRMLARAFAEGLGEGKAPLPACEAYPLLTAVGRCGALVELPVEPRAGASRTVPVERCAAVEDAVARLVSIAREGGCACWIRNSVKDAVEGYEAVVAALGPEHVTLFHARFALGDRSRIEQGVLHRFGKGGADAQRAGHVVVATQVVEQSLDIDFDAMVSDLCPIDRLIQRAGRLQRHVRPRRAAPFVLHVLAPAWSDDPATTWLGPPFQRTAHVYPDPGVLWRTARVLQAGAIELPGAARALVEAVYGDATVPAALERRANVAQGQALSHEGVAQNAILKLELGYLRTGADWSSEARTPTRLGEPTMTVRIAIADEGGARALFVDAAGRPLWHLSQLGVARRLVASPGAGAEAERGALEATQPFVDDDTVTLVLAADGADRWSGKAFGERIRNGAVTAVPVRVAYSKQRGLEVEEGERACPTT
jgi:CRISPR-associated endonuclease/helicase Cas3